MFDAIVLILAVTACFLAAIINLAVDSPLRRKLTGIFILCALIIGSASYGYGYAVTQGLSFISLIRALLAVCRMFVGVNDLGTIQAAPLFSRPIVLAVFWTAHFLAYYVMASAAIAALGEKLMNRIRFALLLRGPLLVIYGINAASVTYGRRMAKKERRAVLFVDEDYNPAFENSIKSFGGTVDSTPAALAPTARFLKRLNLEPGKRRLELAVLEPDARKNLEYAQTFLSAMDERGILPEQTSLIASGVGDSAAALQALGGKGFGSVFAFDEYDLTARMIIRDYPPCSLIRFDDLGRALEDFHAVILGFGRMGRAMLNEFVLNGQFVGSRFRLDVFDPNAQNGYLHNQPLMKEYDIRFHSADGGADAFFSFWEENLRSVRVIVLCTGDRAKNQELAADLVRWYPWDEKLPLILYAEDDHYCRITEDGQEFRSSSFFDSLDMDAESLDAVAMQVNQIYCEEAGSKKSALENWHACGYFDRQSSRACADFYPAVLQASGRTAEEVLAGNWPPDGELLENLAQTEHLRWSAWQYVCGYSPMSEEIWEKRAEIWRQGSGGEGFRISKDPKKRLQACLTPWEKLDELSAKENAVTGGHVDYKQMDRNNILYLSRILKAVKKEAGKQVEEKKAGEPAHE